MKARYLTFVGLLTVALSALTACSDAIFATIETEKKVATNTLSQTLSIFDLATIVPGSTYYVAAGGVFQGNLNAGTMSWNPADTSRPWNPPGLLCNAMVYYAGTLWGGFVSSTGSAALYQSSAGPNYSFANSTPVNDSAINGKQAIRLLVANDHLFMSSTPDTTTYGLDYQATGAVPWIAGVISGLPKAITGVAWDGSKYWAASQSTVYVSSDPPTISSFTLAVQNPVPSTDQVNGVFADRVKGRVFLATKLNGIYWSPDGGTTWKQIGADVVNTASVSYLCFAGPADGATADKYLVGSDGYGYYTLSISGNGGTGSISRFGDATVSLYVESVSRILVDGVNVLMGTNANGLWRSVFDTNTGALASGQSWVHE
jgi:hypothetical protein